MFAAVCMLALLACAQTAKAVPRIDLESLINPVPAPLVMSADNVTEGQDIRIRIGVDPSAGGCDATFPFLVDLAVESQTPGMLEGNRRSGNTLGPTLPALRTVRLESCADTAIETFKTVENETDELPSLVTMHITPAGATDVLLEADRVTKEVDMPPCTKSKTAASPPS